MAESTLEARVGNVEQRLGALERRVNSMDQRLERVEGKQDAMLAWQQAHSERVTCMMGRFDDLEKLIRESRNGDGS
ncbi:MAG: hypothetical protein OXH58_12680 [Acidimicrobiaceae bacterium]|nr:hypothetical protein [Acidimicrobiaceae bacterium]